MPNKKQIKSLLRKATIIFVASAVILCMMALPLGTFAPQPAKAAVTVSAISGADAGMMIGPGMLFPALDINVAAGAGETLVSVKVNILIPEGSSFDPETSLAPLSATESRAGVTLYKDNKSAGVFGCPDPPDDFYDVHLHLASTPTWSQSDNSTYEITLTLDSADAVPANDTDNNSGTDYFVVISTSHNPPPDATFQVQIPANGVTLDDTTTFPSSVSPASPNVITIGQGGMMGSPVVISEIQTAGGTASDEFIELYNRAPEIVDLSSWSIQYAADNLSASSTASSVNLSGNITGSGFFLIANSGYDDGGIPADVTYTDADFALATSGGTVFLVNNQIALTSPTDPAIQDKVGWGTGTISPYAEGTAAPAPDADGSIERKAFHEATVTSMTTGIDATMGNSCDSDSNINDFIVRTAADAADPQNTSDTESPEMSGDNPVVINEVYYNNASSDHQWIELYNNDDVPDDISGFKISAAGDNYTIPALTEITAGGYLVVHWNADGTDNATNGNLYTGTTSWAAMPTLAGDVYLTDDLNAAEDYVEYGAGGQTNESTAGGSEWPAGDFVPGVLQGHSNYH